MSNYFKIYNFSLKCIKQDFYANKKNETLNIYFIINKYFLTTKLLYHAVDIHIKI